MTINKVLSIFYFNDEAKKSLKHPQLKQRLSFNHTAPELKIWAMSCIADHVDKTGNIGDML